jgi:hypothetical protein
MEREDGTSISTEEIERMRYLLKQIEAARIELANIQHYHHTYSISRVCEPAAYVVECKYNEKILWNN